MERTQVKPYILFSLSFGKTTVAIKPGSSKANLSRASAFPKRFCLLVKLVWYGRKEFNALLRIGYQWKAEIWFTINWKPEGCVITEVRVVIKETALSSNLWYSNKVTADNGKGFNVLPGFVNKNNFPLNLPSGRCTASASSFTVMFLQISTTPWTVGLLEVFFGEYSIILGDFCNQHR